MSFLRNLILFGGLAGIGLGVYGRYLEPRRLQVTHLDLADGQGKHTVAFVSDTHIGPHFSARDLEPTIQALERIRPDAILFGGDLICESPRYLRQLEDPLRRMTATARLGSWGIWGNHDLANIRARCVEVYERAGVKMLTNQSAHVVDDLWVVGIDDLLLGEPDIETSFAGVPREARTIALWHAPDQVEEIAPYRPMITLSGHTHGGQVRIPVLGPLATPELGKRYVAGRYDVDGMLLYVSRGIGMYRPPVRVHCRPELLILHV